MDSDGPTSRRHGPRSQHPGFKSGITNVLVAAHNHAYVEGRVINVRRLVALDITLHGRRFIAAEFGIGTPVILAVGTILVLSNQPILGTYLLLTGANYLPLLVYTYIIVRNGTAHAEVADQVSEDKHYVRKYSVQQFLLFLPLVVLWLAVWQELVGNRVTAIQPLSQNDAA